MDNQNISKCKAADLRDKMSHKKVYINPNFSKNSSLNYIQDNVAPRIKPELSNSVIQNAKEMGSINTKIYINPNFIKSKNPPVTHTKVLTSQNESFDNMSSSRHVAVSYKYNDMSDKPTPQITTGNINLYTLVRTNKTDHDKVILSKKATNMIKLNKYKLVPLNNFRNSITDMKCFENATLKNIKNTPLIHNQKFLKHNTQNTTVFNISKNRHKFIKYKPFLATEFVSNRYVDSTITKQATKKNTTIIKTKVFKKNYIPCPLFKKFGTCIRQARDHCDFLHDKKHVSICRKFLKGACHDKDCLLSHDLTGKMPTCYFYLKGMCTKDDCPYLHIKLNESSKICSDFLKGYCQNGKKCLNRHVNISFGTKVNHVNLNKHQSNYKYNKRLVNKTVLKSSTSSNNDVKKCTRRKIDTVPKTESEKLKQDIRYYQDLKGEPNNKKEMCEIIKPSRCKLGILPSYIQL